MKPKLLHCPLESYQERYSQFLHAWERRAFASQFDVQTITPAETGVPLNITSGEVLDTIARPLWALQQTQELLKLHHLSPKVWMSDFYHPGLDTLAYSRKEFRPSSFLWAQTFDKFDFTTKHHLNWMRPWEIMAFNVYEKVFVACDMLKELIVTALPEVESKIFVVGLPFDHLDVQDKLRNLPAYRDIDLVYTSRFDEEKNPAMFLNFVEEYPQHKYAICTGAPQLRGTDHEAVRRAKRMQESGMLYIYENCTKQQYYEVLARSVVQFNCGLQDWVSFTLLEALTFGCLPLYPAHRSFPDTLNYNNNYMYRPYGEHSAYEKFQALLEEKPKDYQEFRAEILTFHSQTLNRIAKIIAE